ncbi:MAG: DNA polymerase IV [Pseudomonadota bacterium]
MTALRTILHVDMDAFYASVEQRDNPELRGKPLVVGGAGARGVVAAASYEARRFGIHSAMPVSRARRLCADLLIVPNRMGVYAEVSRQVFAVFHRYTPLVEALSLDEAFLDVTASKKLHGSGIDIATKIRQGIDETLNLTASVGVASNKFLAKVASDLDKPDGLTVVPHPPQQFLDPLPVRRIWGVGKKAAERLATIGVTTIGDLRRQPEGRLRSLLGRHADRLSELAQGLDERPVVPDREDKSVSHEETYGRDLTDFDACDRQLLSLSAAVGARLRRKGISGQVVRVKIRLADFTTLSRQLSLHTAVDDDLSISRAARGLFTRWWRRHPDCAIRLLGVGVSQLKESQRQDDLFGPSESATIDKLKDRISERFQDAGLKPAALVKPPGKTQD